MADTTRVRFTYDAFDTILRQLPIIAGEVVEETLDDLDVTVKRMMREPKSGRRYGNHIASAPGEAPAVDTTRLINSLTKEMTTPRRGYYYTEVEYSETLELGGMRIAPRPYMKPAAELVRPDFMQKMANLERRLRL